MIADFGRDAIDRMTRTGETSVLLSDLDGQPLGKTNFVLADSRGRFWFTVTTRLDPWTRSVNEKAPDGYVGLIDEDGLARIVADGFVGTNEIRFDEAEEWLYVVSPTHDGSRGSTPSTTARWWDARCTGRPISAGSRTALPSTPPGTCGSRS